MPFTTLSAELTYTAIQLYFSSADWSARSADTAIRLYFSGTEWKVMRQKIAQLTDSDIVSINTRGETLLFSAIPSNTNDSIEKHRDVMELLLDQAHHVSPHSWNAMLVLLCQKNIHNISPLNKILGLDCRDEDNSYVTTDIEGVGSVFFSYLTTLFRNIKPPTLHQSIDWLSLDSKTLYLALMCQHQNNRENYFNWIHDVIFSNPDLVSAYTSLFLKPDKNGDRLFDRIKTASRSAVRVFLDEVQFMQTQSWISRDQSEYILTYHARAHEGFSSLHDLIRLNDLVKINAYIHALNRVQNPKTFARELLKKNKHGVMAIQLGINNGNGYKDTSVEMASYFIGFLDPMIYFSLDECLTLIHGNKDNERLRCISGKNNSSAINQLIEKRRLALMAIKQRIPGHVNKLTGSNDQVLVNHNAASHHKFFNDTKRTVAEQIKLTLKNSGVLDFGPSCPS